MPPERVQTAVAAPYRSPAPRLPYDPRDDDLPDPFPAKDAPPLPAGMSKTDWACIRTADIYL